MLKASLSTLLFASVFGKDYPIPSVHNFKSWIDGDHFKFQCDVQPNHYFALGFGTSMNGSGVFFMSGKQGMPHSEGRYATGHHPPALDATQTISQENVQHLPNGNYRFTMSRQLDTTWVKMPSHDLHYQDVFYG